MYIKIPFYNLYKKLLHLNTKIILFSTLYLNTQFFYNEMI